MLDSHQFKFFKDEYFKYFPFYYIFRSFFPVIFLKTVDFMFSIFKEGYVDYRMSFSGIKSPFSKSLNFSILNFPSSKNISPLG